MCVIILEYFWQEAAACYSSSSLRHWQRDSSETWFTALVSESGSPHSCQSRKLAPHTGTFHPHCQLCSSVKSNSYIKQLDHWKFKVSFWLIAALVLIAHCTFELLPSPTWSPCVIILDVVCVDLASLVNKNLPHSFYSNCFLLRHVETNITSQLWLSVKPHSPSDCLCRGCTGALLRQLLTLAHVITHNYSWHAWTWVCSLRDFSELPGEERSKKVGYHTPGSLNWRIGYVVFHVVFP